MSIQYSNWQLNVHYMKFEVKLACISQMLLSTAPYIAFHGMHLISSCIPWEIHIKGSQTFSDDCTFFYMIISIIYNINLIHNMTY